ncbi:UNVERIFIED_CONTAM: hypothetical protein GTU68_028819 [Idotea baltica]|nr:hypothetical protein [Idotea baltica]
MNFQNQKVAYISGEESPQQIKIRAQRIGELNDQCYIINDTQTDLIIDQLKQLKPAFAIIDSIQTLHSQLVESIAGSISQIRQCTQELQHFGKQNNIPIFLIGHINKEGNIAGPKVLEHIVDTVLQFEGDRNYSYRILRSIKNRFGPAGELGIYEMQQSGLRIVDNPSELLIGSRDSNVSGTAIACSIEGNRPLLLETQALVSDAVFGNPQRSTTGFHLSRINMLLAVIEKKLGLKMASKDVFSNIAGGIKIQDPAIDLAMVAALISSYTDVEVNPDICLAGEIGLSGEIRNVSRIENRISEAARLGFKQIIVAKQKKAFSKANTSIQISPVENIRDLYQLLFA